MPPLRVLLLAPLGLAPLGLAACGLPFSPDRMCTLEYRPGLLVHVRDAATHWPISGGATVVARDGAFVDTLHHADFTVSGDVLSLAGAYERAGTYSVRVEHPGYIPLEWPEAVVSDGPCGIRTLALIANLVRE
jgi:hypothetical protein